MSNKYLQWSDIPDEFLSEWTKIFYASQEGINLSSICPICEHRKLHCYYHLNRYEEKIVDGRKYIGHGSLWQWCSNCRKYVHYSALVPEWWNDSLKVNVENLYHSPENIDKAIN
ncbi:MAG: hypothetical protein AAF383_29690 [Cyanobacteria bacterium P01_A01_bin.83]